MNLLDQLIDEGKRNHTSISDQNAYLGDMGYWFMTKVGGVRVPVGAAAHRGSASELGIAAFLMGDADYEEAVHRAVTEFDRLTALSGDPNRDKERKGTEAMVRQGIECLKDYGKPSATQRQITYQHPDLRLPFVGYVDFDWSQHGMLMDLKTTFRLHSSIQPSHARQVALYVAASGDNQSARVAYVTDKRHAVYELENAREHLKAVIETAKAMEEMLSAFRDFDHMKSAVVPNYDSFYWNSPQARQAGYDFYGF